MKKFDLTISKVKVPADVSPRKCIRGDCRLSVYKMSGKERFQIF